MFVCLDKLLPMLRTFLSWHTVAHVADIFVLTHSCSGCGHHFPLCVVSQVWVKLRSCGAAAQLVEKPNSSRIQIFWWIQTSQRCRSLYVCWFQAWSCQGLDQPKKHKSAPTLQFFDVVEVMTLLLYVWTGQSSGWEIGMEHLGLVVLSCCRKVEWGAEDGFCACQ